MKLPSKSKTTRTAILLVLISTIFTSIGQILLKNGVETVTNLVSILNFSLIFGLVFYGFALLLVLKAFKHGELSVLYPLLALGYIWVVLLSNFFFGESLNSFKILGVVTIFIGVVLIGLSRE